jgi:hypothetical protein
MRTIRHRLALAARLLEVIDARRKQERDFGRDAERDLIDSELSLLEAETAASETPTVLLDRAI